MDEVLEALIKLLVYGTWRLANRVATYLYGSSEKTPPVYRRYYFRGFMALISAYLLYLTAHLLNFRLLFDDIMFPQYVGFIILEVLAALFLLLAFTVGEYKQGDMRLVFLTSVGGLLLFSFTVFSVLL